MPRFCQHIPSSCDFGPPDEFRFDTLDQLLANPAIDRFRRDDRVGPQVFPFHRFSRSVSELDSLLMVEYDEGRRWWVVGYLWDDEGIDLPKWVPVREEEPNS